MNTTKSICSQALYSQVRDKHAYSKLWNKVDYNEHHVKDTKIQVVLMLWSSPICGLIYVILKKNQSSVDICGLVILDILLCLFRISLCMEHIFFTWRIDWSGDWKYFSSLFMLLLCRYFNRGRKHYSFIWCKIIRNTIAKLSSHILVDGFLHTLLLIYSKNVFS